MRTRPLTKALAALATTLAVLTLMATPASATVYPYVITQGDIVIDTNGGPTLVWSLTAPDPDPCELGDNGTFEVDLVGTTTSATTEFVSFDVKTTFWENPAGPSGDLFQVDLSLVPTGSGGSNSGSHSGTASAGTGTQDLTLAADIYRVEAPTCTKEDLVCTVYIFFSGLSETYVGPANAATEIYASGPSTLLVGSPCNPPLDGWFNGGSGAEAEITDI